MSRKIVVLAFVLLGVSCAKKHDAILPINDMKAVMWDMLNADSWFSDMSMRDSVMRASKKNLEFYNEVFVQHDITKDQFYKSYKYYEINPKKMKVLMDSVEAYGTRAKLKLDAKPPKAAILKLPK